jgi:hypothetical protein
MTDLLHKFDPAVDKKWLNLAAGLMWSGVGVMLIAISTRWLHLDNLLTILELVLAGLALGTVIYLFGFSKVARKNIRRIATMPAERNCIFAFQEWKTYPLVIFMIFLGIYLRVYSPFPKPLLAITYIGIGSSLFTSSLQYYWQMVANI